MKRNKNYIKVYTTVKFVLCSTLTRRHYLTSVSYTHLFGWLGKIAGAFLGMMLIGNNAGIFRTPDTGKDVYKRQHQTMAIRTNTNPRQMDLQPEMRNLLMRNGLQAHGTPFFLSSNVASRTK